MYIQDGHTHTYTHIYVQIHTHTHAGLSIEEQHKALKLASNFASRKKGYTIPQLASWQLSDKP